MAVLRPSLEYGCEMWNTNKCQAQALESIQLYVLASIFWEVLEQVVMSLQELISRHQ